MARRVGSKRMNSKTVLTMCMIVSIGIGIFALCYLYRQYASRRNVEGLANQGKSAKLMYFYADWCPHCKKAKPHWEKCVKSNDGKKFGDYTLTTEEVDCSEGRPAQMEEYGVDGFPTIILDKGNSDHVQYNKAVTSDGLNDFLAQNLN